MSTNKTGVTGVFVERPILALVLSLLIIIAGLAAFNAVEIRELPDVEQPTISVSVDYPGAAPRTVDAEVTTVLEDSLAQLEGVKGISSTSTYGNSTITIDLRASVDLATAANEARELVASAARNLPEDLEDPVIRKNDANADPVLRLALTGSVTLAELTSLAENRISQRLTEVDGVAEIRIYGEQQRIIRVTFYPIRLASRGLSITDLRNALTSANLDQPLGTLDTDTQSLIVRSVASATTVEAINRIRLNRDTVVGDVAFVQATSEDPTSYSRVNGQPAVVLNVIRQSLANSLTISKGVRAAVAELQDTLPSGVALTVASDDGIYIESSIDGVVSSIFLAVAIVILVIILFLRSWRAVVVATVTVPISLVGTVAAIWLMNFSINTISLLALVLATGMVVDDAIVVLDNIVRRREEGIGPYAAAAKGVRQVFFAVISTTATLAAVFIPISFLPGQAGGIFSEFGYVLTFAVTISSFVALTLCPVLCALLDVGKRGADKAAQQPRPAASANAPASDKPAYSLYERTVLVVLRWRYLVIVGATVFAAFAATLYTNLPRELTPKEDRGLIIVVLRTPTSASLEYTSSQANLVEEALAPFVERGVVGAVQSIIGRRGDKSSAFVLARLIQWEDRDMSQAQIIAELQKPLNSIPGALVSLRAPNSLGIRGAGRGIQFAVSGNDYDHLTAQTALLIEAMRADTAFLNPQLVSEASQPQLALDINRELAADLGVSPQEVITTLNTIIEDNEATSLFLQGESVEIMMKAGGRPVDDQTDLENVFIKTSDGQFVALSTFASLKEISDVATLSREGRRPVVPGQANLGPGVDLGAAAARLAELADEVLDDNVNMVLLGEAATLDESESGTLMVFAVAILIVLLVLAAQFESFSSALIIVTTVPFGLGAALVAIYLSGGSLNYYSQIGLVMLVGIMAKNGILIVEFANQLRERGADVHDAIFEAMRLRIRPVMMTMISTVCGGLPLLIATGAGAEARTAVGWVIVGGLGFATIFTLYLTPALYRIIAPISKPTGATQRRVAQELSPQP